jgi:tRNA A-37 threonylcarbamoyl transferase component Bud32
VSDKWLNTTDAWSGQAVSAWVNQEEKSIVIKKRLGRGTSSKLFTDGRFVIKIDRTTRQVWSRQMANSSDILGLRRLSHECAMLNRAVAAGVRAPACFSRYQQPMVEPEATGVEDNAHKLRRYRWGDLLGRQVNDTTGIWEAMVMDLVPGKRFMDVNSSEWNSLRREELTRVFDEIVSNCINMLRAGLTTTDTLWNNIMVDLATQNVTLIDFGTARTDDELRALCGPQSAAIVTNSTSEGAANTVCPPPPVDLMLARILKRSSSRIPLRKELLPVVLAKHGAQIKALEGAKRSEFDKFCYNNRECLEAIGGKYAGQTVQAVSF